MSQTPLDVGIVGWHSHNQMFDEISVDLRKAGHRITRYAHREASPRRQIRWPASTCCYAWRCFR
jgi:hypothetical protein